MFSDTFNQIATLAGINTDDLVTRIGSIDERYKDSDKGDINIAADWLKTISEEVSVKEVAFLLMAALRPEAPLKDYKDEEEASMEQFIEMLQEQGFVELPDGSWVSPAYLETIKKEEEKESTKDLPEPKQIGYTSAVEPTRNALGYNHTLSSLLNSIGVDKDLLYSRFDNVFNNFPEQSSASKLIEMLEREFTRKELAYMFYNKSKELSDLEFTIMEEKPKRKTRTTKNKKDNGNI